MEAGQYEEIVAKWLQWLENAREFELRPGLFRRPVVHYHAVRRVDEHDPSESVRLRLCPCRKRGDHRVEPRQRNGRSYASQKRSPWQMLPCDDHGVTPRLRFEMARC